MLQLQTKLEGNYLSEEEESMLIILSMLIYFNFILMTDYDFSFQFIYIT